MCFINKCARHVLGHAAAAHASHSARCPYTPPHPLNVDFPHLILRYRAAGARCLRPASCTLHVTSFMLSAFSVKDGNLAAAQSCVGVTGSGASSGSLGDRCTRICAAYSTCGCCDVLVAVPGGWRWRKLKITRRIPFQGAWPTTRGPHL